MMINMDEEIIAVREMISILKKIEKDLKKQEGELVMKTRILEGASAAGLLVDKECKEKLSEKKENISKKRNCIHVIIDKYQKILDLVEFYWIPKQNFNYILTKRSYLEYLDMIQEFKKVLSEMKTISVPIINFLNCENAESIDFQKINLLSFVESLLLNLQYALNTVSFERKTILLNGNMDYTVAANLNDYYSLQTILKESLKKKYDYETYYKLAYTFSQIAYLNFQTKNGILKESKEIENEELKNNAYDVISRNLDNDVIGLYEKETILDYRESILKEMLKSRGMFDIEQENANLLKLKRIAKIIK